MEKATRKDLTGRTGEKTLALLESIDNQIQIKTHLGRLLAERNMTQSELARVTGIGNNMISAFVANREGVKIGYAHIYALMIALRLTDISELLYVDMPDEIAGRFAKESADWKLTKDAPSDIRMKMDI